MKIFVNYWPTTFFYGPLEVFEKMISGGISSRINGPSVSVTLDLDMFIKLASVPVFYFHPYQ